jgi:hypothetical protein
MLDEGMGRNGKILNAPPFPLIGASYEANSFSSDQAAWMQTLSAPFSQEGLAAPIGNIRWGSCTTAGAFNNRLLERDSLGTVIDLVDGLWVCFSSPNNDNESDEHSINVEAIVLEPGTRLYVLSTNISINIITLLTIPILIHRIVRPNTVQAFYTHTNSICHGSRYIASSTMMDALSGFTHNFTPNNYNKNTLRNQLKHIFRRMIIFYHMALVRDVIEHDGIHELTYSICVANVT